MGCLTTGSEASIRNGFNGQQLHHTWILIYFCYKTALRKREGNTCLDPSTSSSALYFVPWNLHQIQLYRHTFRYKFFWDKHFHNCRRVTFSWWEENFSGQKCHCYYCLCIYIIISTLKAPRRSKIEMYLLAFPISSSCSWLAGK